jgi:non-heme chloroperoxidase
VPNIGRLHYLEAHAPHVPSAGGRPRGTLVLLHAFPLSAAMWEPQLSFAESGWRVVAPEIGRTPSGPRLRSMDDCAGEVIDLLDALHIHEAVVAGLSMGGYAALSMFRHAPRYFQGLVLCDTRAEADSPEALENRRRMQQLVRDRGPAAVADEMIPKLVGAASRATRPDLVERVRSLVVANTAESISGAIDALMARQDSTDILHSIHCPTLIVVGEEDTVTPLALSEKMHTAIAGSELSVISRAGHLSSLEQPGEFNRVLADFLEHRV